MHERIAKLETKQDLIHTDLKDHIAEEKTDKMYVINELHEMKESLQKQKGFIAGVAAAVSAIVAAIGMAFKYLGG